MANKTLKLTCAFCQGQLKPLEMGICRPCKEKNRHLRTWRRHATDPNSGDFSHIVGWNVKAGPCIGGALGAAVIRLIHK